MKDTRLCLNIPREIAGFGGEWIVMAAAFGTGENGHLSVLLGFNAHGAYAVANANSTTSEYTDIRTYDAGLDGELMPYGEPMTRPPALQLATLDWAQRSRPFLEKYAEQPA